MEKDQNFLSRDASPNNVIIVHYKIMADGDRYPTIMLYNYVIHHTEAMRNIAKAIYNDNYS